MMVLANCLSALWMEDQGLGACFAIAVAVLAVTVALSTLTGVDHHRLGGARHHRHPGRQLRPRRAGPLGHRPTGRGTSPDFQRIVAGGLSNWWPSVLWIVGALLAACGSR